jgi:glycosyltransferase involved in cell wall biosynthesis
MRDGEKISLKVLHVITTIDIGGAENQLLILASQQVAAGKEVSIIHLKGIGELKEKFNYCGITVIDDLADENLLAQLKILRRRINEGWDIVHCHLPRAEILTSIAAKKIVPIVASRHFGGEFFPGAGTRISRCLSQLFTRKFSYIIAISETVRSYLVSSQEIIGKPIEVVEYAFSKTEFLGSSMRNKRVPSKPVIGIVSRLSKEKRVDVAIAIFNNFLEVSPNAELLICGEGAELGYLEKIVLDYGIKDNVKFLGKRSDIQEYYSRFDLLLHASEFEGFGMVYVEAMSFDLPILYLSKSGLMSTLDGIYGTILVENYKDSTKTNRDFQKALEMNPEEINKSFSTALERFSPSEMEAKISWIYNLSRQL